MSTPSCKAPFSLVVFVLGALAAGTGCAAAPVDGTTSDELPLNGSDASKPAMALDVGDRTEVSPDRAAQDLALGRQKLEAEPDLALTDIAQGRDFAKALELDLGITDAVNAQKPLVRPPTP